MKFQIFFVLFVALISLNLIRKSHQCFIIIPLTTTTSPSTNTSIATNATTTTTPSTSTSGTQVCSNINLVNFNQESFRLNSVNGLSLSGVVGIIEIVSNTSYFIITDLFNSRGNSSFYLFKIKMNLS
jgi:hypothetical protein